LHFWFENKPSGNTGPQFDDIYDATKTDPYSRAFTMALMVGLVIWGSLIMVNLLIAIIVSDISQVRGIKCIAGLSTVFIHYFVFIGFD
jgi:hypothetical protein